MILSRVSGERDRATCRAIRLYYRRADFHALVPATRRREKVTNITQPRGDERALERRANTLIRHFRRRRQRARCRVLAG